MAEAKLYVRASPGRYANWRWACIWLTQLVYFGLPWLRWDGAPLILLDLPARRLTLFGSWWWPHDLVLLALLLLVGAGALFLASALAGRVFCGYACPHSVYADIFMWIERRIEGNPGARMRLDRAPLSLAKLGKKAAKHGAWLLFSLWTGVTLVSYFSPVRVLLEQLGQGALGPWEGFCMGAYATLAYLNAGAMRERFCRFICPWGRFQGLLIGNDTLVVGYHAARGEPRALRNRKSLARGRAMGDCIDCTLCVQVCPTGIDIRRGQAFDCIGCAACADACDLVMDKIGAPRGLVGYARMERDGAPSRARGAAAALLGLALAGLGFGLAARDPFKLAVLHDRAVPLRLLDGGMVENVYRLHVINTDRRPHRYRIAVSGLGPQALAAPQQLLLEAGAARVLALRIQAAAGAGRPGAHPITVELVELEPAARRVRHQAVFFTTVW